MQLTSLKYLSIITGLCVGVASCLFPEPRPETVPADAVYRGATGHTAGWWQRCEPLAGGRATCWIWNAAGVPLEMGEFRAFDDKPVSADELGRISTTGAHEHTQITLEGGRRLAPATKFWSVKASAEGWSYPPPQTIYVDVRDPARALINGARVAIVDPAGTELAVAYTAWGLPARLPLPLDPQVDALSIVAEHPGFATAGNSWRLGKLPSGAVMTLTRLSSLADMKDQSGDGIIVRVVDVSDGHPIPNARVLLLGAGTGELGTAFTDAAGVARLARPTQEPSFVMMDQDPRLGPYYRSGVRWEHGRSAYTLAASGSCEPDCPWQQREVDTR